MDPFADLQTYSEIGIAATALPALMVALGGKRIHEPMLTAYLSYLFSWALAVLFFSLFPRLLLVYGLDAAEIWRIGLLGVGIHAGIHLVAGFAWIAIFRSAVSIISVRLMKTHFQ